MTTVKEKPYRLKMSDGNQTIIYHKHFESEKEADAYFMSGAIPAQFNGWAVDIIKIGKGLA